MILVVFGTRPEALKLSNVCALAKSRGLNVHVHCTMQSPDLVDQAILPWDTDGSLLPIIHSNPRPRLVVVQGDTRTAFEAAVMAYELGLPIFYVESGVRTYDLASPWPEEGYRQMIARIATYHACTTQMNVLNLLRDGVEVRYRTTGRTALPRTGVTGWTDLIHVRPETILDGNVRVTGSPIVESVRERAAVALTKPPAMPYLVVTLHRRENRGRFADILNGVSDAIGKEVAYSWFAHPNGWAVQECDNGMNHQSPLNAVDFAAVLRDAACVVTDSGGVQEESCCVGTPAVVARSTTDRPESLHGLLAPGGPDSDINTIRRGGGAILAGTSREGVAKAIRQALLMDRSTIQRDIFGDGTASEKVVSWWTEIVGQT